jgi:hypothetical protein
VAPTPILITGSYSNPDSSPCTGYVTFLLSTPISQPGIVVQPEPIVVELGADGALSVTLYANNDPATVPTTSQYIVVEQTDGAANRQYTITVPYNAAGATADISTLQGDIASSPIFDGEGTDQFISFITPNDLMDWLQIPMGSITSPQVVVNMQRVCDYACAWVQRYCNRPLCPTTYAERHDGWSGSDIMLKRVPFLDLVLCTEYQSAGGLLTLVEATPTSNNNDANVIQIDRSTSMIRRAFSGYSWPRTFFPGSRSVSIVYTAGFDPVPPDVWMGTMMMASYTWAQSQQSLRENVRGGADPDALSMAAGLWQGVPYRVTAALDAYCRISIG